MKILLLIATLLCAGCRTIAYQDGNRQVRIMNLGLDTSIGHLEWQTKDGKVVVDDFASKPNDKAMDTVGKAIDRIPLP